MASAILLAAGAALIASVGSAEAAPPVANGKIVFASSRDTGPRVDKPEEDGELFAMDPDGMMLQQLTKNGLDDVAPPGPPRGAVRTRRKRERFSHTISGHRRLV